MQVRSLGQEDPLEMGNYSSGNGNLLQYSCLGDPMDRGAQLTTVHGVAKSWTQLSVWAQRKKQSTRGREKAGKGGMTSKLSIPGTWPCSSEEPGKEPVSMAFFTQQMHQLQCTAACPLSHPILLVPYLPRGPEDCQACMWWSSLGRRSWDVSVWPRAISGPLEHHKGWLFAWSNSLGNHYRPSSFGAGLEDSVDRGPSTAIKRSPVLLIPPLAPGLWAIITGAGFIQVILGPGARNETAAFVSGKCTMGRELTAY